MKNQELRKAPLLKGNLSSFSKREIVEAIQKGNLLAAYIETKGGCTLKCPFCYTAGWKNDGRERSLKLEEMKKIVDVVREFGAKSIIIAGKGEPLLDPALLPLTEYNTKKGLWTVIFTNTTTLTEEIAKHLYSLNTTIIAKLGSLNPEKQDYMVGVPGAHEKIWRGLELLLEAGFRQPRLGVDVTILRSNINETESIWRYLRTREIIPYIEPLIIEGAAKEWTALDTETVSLEEIYSLFKKLKKIDAEEYGYELHIDSTRTPGTLGCGEIKRPLIAITIRSNGDVGLCVNADRRNAIGNIFEGMNGINDIIINLKRIIEMRRSFYQQFNLCSESCMGVLRKNEK
jgi:MoaA/NifB/PqqE/SkfB family radical SAM enzyme